MNKLSKRAILTFIIATFLIGMIPIVHVMATPDVEVVETGGLSVWTTEKAKAGIYSLHVTLPVDVEVRGLDVIASPTVPILLSDITEIKFWEYVVVPGGDILYIDPPAGDIEIATGITLYLDKNDDGVFDWTNDVQIVLECPKNDPLVLTNLNTWDERDAFTDGYTGFDKGGGQLDLPSGDITHWKTTAYSTYDVLSVGLVLGWGNYGNYEGYLDDITVNGVAYPIESDLPPPPGTGFSIDYVTLGDVVYGKVLTVMGSGVTAGSTVNLYWDTVTSAGLLNTTTGLPSGDFECTVKVPSAVYGDHYIWARDVSTGLTTRSDPIHVVSKVKLSPSSGLKGDSVIVKGYGFSKTSDIDIDFGTLSDATGVDKTDALGYFEYTFKVGAVDDGIYTVTATDTHSASADFTVGVALTLDKTVGPAGTIVKVDGRGFNFGTVIANNVDITLDGIPGIPVSTKDGKDIITSGTGTFTAYLVIPSVSKGDHKITINGGTGKVATATFEVDGVTKIKLTPSYGTPGAVVTVKGYNYSQVPVDVTITLGSAEWTTKTNSDGEWSRDITIPPLDIGEDYPVVASDERNCKAEKNVLVALILVQLSETSGPVGTKVNLMGVGFDDTGGGDWNATFEDIGIIGNSGIVTGSTTFSKEFWVPSVAPGTYTITVTDWKREVDVTSEFTVTEPAKLTPKRTQGPNRYNLSIHGENFAEDEAVETTWYLYNSTRVWDISDDVEYGGAPVETTEYGNFTGYFKIPWNLELGEYTINCTTKTTVADVTVEQYAETTFEIVPEEMDIRIGKSSYARGDIITFTIKASLQKEEFYLGIKDPEGNEMFNSTWKDSHWKTIGAWYYIPQNLQIDDFTEDQYTLPSDATPGTWSYALWDVNSTIMDSGTFEVTEKTEIEMLQDSITGVTEGLTNVATTVTDLETSVGAVSDAIAISSVAADAAKAAADAAKAAADANTAAIGEVSDKADDAKAAADAAKDAADSAKTAADNSLEASENAKVEASGAKAAAENAAEAAEGAQRSSGGLTTLVYGAIAASLVAALAAIVSLMQISKRIAG